MTIILQELKDRDYRLLTLYCEIIVGPSSWADVAELARLRSPKNEVQRCFHSTGLIFVCFIRYRVLMPCLKIFKVYRINFRNNFIKLNVYFEDLNYEKIAEEEDISQAKLLSDVGGAISLWIKLSILSFCEIVQLLFEVIDILMYKLRRPRQKRREKRQQQDIELSNINRQRDQFPVKERGPDGMIYGRSGIPTRFSNEYRNSFNQLDEYTYIQTGIRINDNASGDM